MYVISNKIMITLCVIGQRLLPLAEDIFFCEAVNAQLRREQVSCMDDLVIEWTCLGRANQHCEGNVHRRCFHIGQKSRAVVKNRTVIKAPIFFKYGNVGQLLIVIREKSIRSDLLGSVIFCFRNIYIVHMIIFRYLHKNYIINIVLFN